MYLCSPFVYCTLTLQYTLYMQCHPYVFSCMFSWMVNCMWGVFAHIINCYTFVTQHQNYDLVYHCEMFTLHLYTKKSMYLCSMQWVHFTIMLLWYTAYQQNMRVLLWNSKFHVSVLCFMKCPVCLQLCNSMCCITGSKRRMYDRYGYLYCINHVCLEFYFPKK